MFIRSLGAALLVVTGLTGCASYHFPLSPSAPEKAKEEYVQIPATAHEKRAYEMGVEQRLISSCIAEFGPTDAQHYYFAADTWIKSAPLWMQGNLRYQFNQGVKYQPRHFGGPDCEEIKAETAERIRCVMDEARNQFKAQIPLQ